MCFLQSAMWTSATLSRLPVGSYFNKDRRMGFVFRPLPCILGLQSRVARHHRVLVLINPIREPAHHTLVPFKLHLRRIMKSSFLHHAILLGFFGVLCFPIATLAQTAPLSYRMESQALATGLHSSGPTDVATRVVYRTIIKVPGAPCYVCTSAMWSLAPTVTSR